MSSLRRRLRSPAAPPPLEDENLLSEILLRLPPQPSSLPRASAVCRSWRSLVADARFIRRFRLHHRRNAPLLGFFHRGAGAYVTSFFPTLEAPNRVPPGRFSLPFDKHFWFLGCRHGLVLIFDQNTLKFLVWDPVTALQSRLTVPPGFDPAQAVVNGAVLRSAARDVQHFKVVLVVADNNDSQNRRWLSCVYSSETGVWGNLISTPIPSWRFIGISTKPAVLVGNSLYWILLGNSPNVLEFDVETESLSVIPMPRSVDDVLCFTIMPAEGGGLGFLSVSGFTAQLWRRKTDSDRDASWEMGTTIELDKLLSLNSDDDYVVISGFVEDNNLVLLYTAASLFTVQFESLQFKKLTKPKLVDFYHPLESVYAAGI